MDSSQTSPIRTRSIGQTGQVVVEYVLILTVAVSIAIIIVTTLVRRDAQDPANSGALIIKWQQIQEEIGKDVQN